MFGCGTHSPSSLTCLEPRFVVTKLPFPPSIVRRRIATRAAADDTRVDPKSPTVACGIPHMSGHSEPKLLQNAFISSPPRTRWASSTPLTSASTLNTSSAQKLDIGRGYRADTSIWGMHKGVRNFFIEFPFWETQIKKGSIRIWSRFYSTFCDRHDCLRELCWTLYLVLSSRRASAKRCVRASEPRDGAQPLHVHVSERARGVRERAGPARAARAFADPDGARPRGHGGDDCRAPPGRGGDELVVNRASAPQSSKSSTVSMVLVCMRFMGARRPLLPKWNTRGCRTVCARSWPYMDARALRNQMPDCCACTLSHRDGQLHIRL